MNENKTFIELCEEGNVNPKEWKQWLANNKIEKQDQQNALGLLVQEYTDLINGTHNMQFFVFKKGLQKPIKNLWAGCYVKFACETETIPPHFEFGWVDVVNNGQGFCKVQCDDNFFGTRALTLRIMDILQILPFKERPLVYYKTMICDDCNECDRAANDLPPESCKYYEFFNAILNKQISDLQFINLYKQVERNQQNLYCNHNDNDCCHNDNDQNHCSGGCMNNGNGCGGNCHCH